MKSKVLGFVMSTVLALGLLTGCGAGGGTEKASDTAAATETQAKTNAETNAETAATEAAASDENTTAADDKKSDGDLQVGIVLPTKDEPRWLQDQKQFETILGDAGFSNQVLFSQGSSATEKTNVETLISQGIDVLIICAQDASAAAASVEEAKAAGVTVIAYDRLMQWITM